MKESYKLIETYPGSPKLGFILDDTWLIKHGTSSHTTHFVNHLAFNPKDYPKNWEKIIEKDYEILSFIATIDCISDKYKTIRKPDEDYTIDDYLYKGCCVQNGNYNIHSVKRLSDGEIFTIGDVIANMCDSEQTIKELYIDNDKKMCLYTSKTSRFTIGNIKKKVKKPLFTTEDGVDVFWGDEYWCVNNASHLWSLFKQTSKERTQLNKTVLAFSTKEKAEEYILLNKPCLSINDVAKVFVSANYTTNKGDLYLQGQKLRDIVKSKINNK